MKNKTVFIILLSFLTLSSCIKETYDLERLSGEVALSPGLVVKAFKGNVTLSNVVEPNDTLVFDNELLKFVFTEDSVFEFHVDDFYSSFAPVTHEMTTLVNSTVINDVLDTLEIEFEEDIKIKKMKVLTGEVSYTVTSWCSFDVTVDLLAPSIDDGGSSLFRSVNVPAGSTVNIDIDLDDVLINFDTDAAQPYNLLPLEYDITVTSGSPVFDPSDSIKVVHEMEEPEFDYATGYFGYHTDESGKDTLDLEMEDFFSRISGSIYLTSPSITVNYLNSFGLPMRIDAEVKGMNDEDEISLDRDPVDLDYPTSLDNREVSSSFTIDKDNSSLPELVSMLPYEIEYYSSAIVNPDGETTEDNIIFGDSRFIADMEVEVPFEFRMANLQLSDTTDNFLVSDDPEEDDPIDMLEEFQLDLYVENGFPLGVSVMIQLYDSVSMTVLESLDTGELWSPAPVDANGRVTGPSTGRTEVEFTPAFIDEAKLADQIILTFTLNTTDNGTKDVKIYSDYSIVFSIGVKAKTSVNLNFNSEDE
ncbi:MAG: hypothetical protein JW965_09885 [Bacteroidales bacterium]|nr:hypothetical protein [Bacteroidales bacterium]